MSGRGEGHGAQYARAGLRGVLIIVVIAALTGALGRGTGLKPATLSTLNIAGIAVMILGSAVVMGAGALSRRASSERRDAVCVALRLVGTAVCGVGAIMVFL